MDGESSAQSSAVTTTPRDPGGLPNAAPRRCSSPADQAAASRDDDAAGCWDDISWPYDPAILVSLPSNFTGERGRGPFRQ